MNTWKKLCTRLNVLFKNNSIESELDQELRFHLESEIENNIKKGMSPAEARRVAQLEFGGLDRTKEECRDSWGVRFVLDTIRDLRHAFRTLGKHKGFSFTVIATLAVGIGAVTTVYSIAYGIMLRPLPYDHPERLTMAFETQMPSSRFLNVSPATYLGWKEEATDFEALAATHDRAYNMSGAGEPVRVYGQTSSANFFSILGVQPALGRDFLPGEDTADKANVVVLSHKLWKSRFEADPSILGQSILLDKAPFTIIGVMPDSFQFNPGYEVYTTIPFTAESRSDYGRTFQVMGRLKPDVSIEQAAAQLETISAHLAATFPSEYEGSGVNLISLHTYFSQGAEVLYFLLGAVGFLLLIACTNIANLQLARSTSRYAEIAVRTVLGAPRWSIVRQLVTESLVFAVIGGVFGILMGRWGLRIVGSFLPAGIPHMDQVSVDGTIVFTAFAIAVCTSLVFGLVPALQTSRIDINSILKNSGRRGTNGSKGTHRARNTLVVAQVAFALILLSGAGLFFRSLTKAQKSDVGYETETTYLGVLLLSDEKYPEPQQQVNVIGQLVERITQVHGIESATFTNHTLPNGGAPMAPYSIGGSPDVDPSQRSFGFYYGVTRDYFDTLRIPLLLGRTFNEMDVLDSTRVVLINEALAKREFGDESPIGRLITIHNEWEIARVIVGVVGNAIQGGRMSPQRPQIYEPYEQIPQLSTSYLFRTNGTPPDTQAVLAAFQSVDPEIPILTMYHVAEGLQHGLKSYRWVVGLFSTFSVIALILASMGIYGVIAFNVAQRTGEIGIRMALGARRSNVVRLVLLHSGRLIIIGMGIGLAGSIALSHLLGSLIYDTSPYDPLTLVSITVILGTAATLACYLPTRRATMIDPMVALRSE